MEVQSKDYNVLSIASLPLRCMLYYLNSLNHFLKNATTVGKLIIIR